MNTQTYTVPPCCFYCACDAVHIHLGKLLCTDHYLKVMDLEMSSSIGKLELNKNEMEMI